MADEIDATTERMETEEALRARYRAEPKREAEPTGYCLWCGDVVEHPLRWCPGEDGCKDDWVRYREAKLRNGVTS